MHLRYPNRCRDRREPELPDEVHRNRQRLERHRYQLDVDHQNRLGVVRRFRLGEDRLRLDDLGHQHLDDLDRLRLDDLGRLDADLVDPYPG